MTNRDVIGKHLGVFRCQQQQSGAGQVAQLIDGGLWLQRGEGGPLDTIRKGTSRGAEWHKFQISAP